MRMLIYGFAGRTYHIVGNPMPQLNYLSSSNYFLFQEYLDQNLLGTSFFSIMYFSHGIHEPLFNITYVWKVFI